jgi:hypothetical protein
VPNGIQLGGVCGAGQGAEVRYALRGRDGDRDDQPPIGAEEGPAGHQQPTGVGLWPGPVQQDQVDVAGGVAESGQLVVAAEGVVASVCFGCGGRERDVVVDIDDEIAGLGVGVEQSAG